MVLGQPIRTDRTEHLSIERQPDTADHAGAGTDDPVGRETAEIVTVRRAVAPDLAAGPADSEPGASSIEAPAQGPPEPTADEPSPKEMVDQMWPHIERRLRMNLLLERERKGTLSGSLWSTGGR